MADGRSIYGYGRGPSTPLQSFPASGFNQQPYYEGVQLENMPSWANLPSKYENILSQRALSQGPSSQAQYLLQGQEAAGQSAIDKMRGQTMGQAQSGLSALAMRGGLSSGARERIMQGASNQAMKGSQGIYGQMLQGRLGTLAADEASKQQALGNLLTLAEQRRGTQLGAWGGLMASKEQAQNQGGGTSLLNPGTWGFGLSQGGSPNYGNIAWAAANPISYATHAPIVNQLGDLTGLW